MKITKKLLSLIIAAIMVMSLAAIPALADGTSDKWNGTSDLTVKASASDRTLTAYQVFKADSFSSTNGTLGNIVWGASAESYSSDILTALVNIQADNAKMPDGSTPPAALVTALKEGTGTTANPVPISSTSTAADVAKALDGLGDDSEAIDAFVDLVASVIVVATNTETKSVTCDSATTTGGNHVYTLTDVSDGYYVIVETTAADTNASRTYSKTMLRLVGDSEVNLKTSSEPPFEKEVVDGTNTSSSGSVSVGDPVSFRITSKVPANIAQYTSGYFFIVKDTMSKGLTYTHSSSSMTIKVGNDNVTVYTSTPATEPIDSKYAVLTVTSNTDGTTSLKIVFHNFEQYAAESDVTIDYTATVNADINTDTTGAGATNDASLTFSNNPSYDYDGDNKDEPDTDDPTGTVTDTSGSKVYLYTTSITINKVGGASNTRLEGAKFKLTGTTNNKSVTVTETYTRVLSPANGTIYWFLCSNNLMESAQWPSYPSNAKTVMYTYTAEYAQTSEDADDAVNYKYSVNTAGVNNGGEGYMAITEYNNLSDEQKALYTWVKGYATYTLTTSEVVNDTSSTSYEGTATAKNGQLVFTDLGVGTYKITEIEAPEGYNLLSSPIIVKVEFTEPTSVGGTDGVWKYTISTTESGVVDTGTISSTETSSQIGTYGGLIMTVKNNLGSTLPQTGGIGTTIFYIVGGILVLGAVVVLVTRRRMRGER